MAPIFRPVSDDGCSRSARRCRRFLYGPRRLAAHGRMTSGRSVSMNSQDMRIVTAVAIMTGTLIIGLEHFSSQPIGNLIHLTQGSSNLKAPSASGGEQTGGGPSGAIDARDNSRMDMRQTSGFSDSGNT